MVEPGPVRFGLIGDIGQTREINPCSLFSFPILLENSQLTARALTGDNVDLILLVGDLSYANGYQPKWDTYSRIYEYSAATIPWMLLPGNHENEAQEGAGFVAYQTRFTMPSKLFLFPNTFD
jgi:hypothetical protein